MKFFAEMLTKDGSSREDEFSEEQERARMSAGYVYVSVSVLTSFFTEDCLFKRAMQRRSRMDMVSEARGSVYRDQKNNHRISWSCAAEHCDSSKLVRVQVDS